MRLYLADERHLPKLVAERILGDDHDSASGQQLLLLLDLTTALETLAGCGDGGDGHDGGSDGDDGAVSQKGGGFCCVACRGMLQDASGLMQRAGQRIHEQLCDGYGLREALQSDDTSLHSSNNNNNNSSIADEHKIVFCTMLSICNDLLCRDRIVAMLIKELVANAPKDLGLGVQVAAVVEREWLEMRRFLKSLLPEMLVKHIPSAHRLLKFMSRPEQDTTRSSQDDLYDSFQFAVSFTIPGASVETPSQNAKKAGWPRRKKQKREGIANDGNCLDSKIVLSDRVKSLADLGAHRDACLAKLALDNVAQLQCDTTVTHDPFYFRGYYRKYERGLPQTPWRIKGEQTIETSLDAYISSPIKKHFKSKSHRFTAAGREDIDVRMLGNGRAFAIIVEDPKMCIFSYHDESDFDTENRRDGVHRLTESLEQEINNSTCDSTAAVTSAPVNVHSLLMLTQSNNGGIMSMLNTGAEDKRKTYRCVVWFERAISSQEIDELHAKHNTGNEAHDTLTIEQKTPVRVLHRRTLDTRIKFIHSIHIVEQHNAHYCTVDLCTSAGTYVKEFVSGDFGRTRPSLGDLFGCDAEILQLDVMSVDMKFE